MQRSEDALYTVALFDRDGCDRADMASFWGSFWGSFWTLFGGLFGPFLGGGKRGPQGSTFLPPGGGHFLLFENPEKRGFFDPPVKTVHHDLSRLGELLNTLKNVHPRDPGVRARTPRCPGMEPPSGGSLLAPPRGGRPVRSEIGV